MTPLIPYVDLEALPLWPGQSALSLKPFGLLVATGVLLGSRQAVSYGRRRGLDVATLSSFISWVVGLGFVFGHVLDVVFYSPERLREDPWAVLRLWDGLSSYGGFTGAVIGAFLWKLRKRTPILPYADAVASGLPLGWVFGRMGCAVVHDHPGVLSEAWFAVRYPGGGRLDLGLIEMTFSVVLALVFWRLSRRAWPWGFFIGWMCVAYGPVRFGLDFLRVAEPAWIGGELHQPDRRYWALTPAQWASLAVSALGIYMLLRVRAKAGDDAAYAAPVVVRSPPATRSAGTSAS